MCQSHRDAPPLSITVKAITNIFFFFLVALVRLCLFRTIFCSVRSKLIPHFCFLEYAKKKEKKNYVRPSAAATLFVDPFTFDCEANLVRQPLVDAVVDWCNRNALVTALTLTHWPFRIAIPFDPPATVIVATTILPCRPTSSYD